MTIHVLGGSTSEEKNNKTHLVQTLRHNTIPDGELLDISAYF